MNKTYKHWKRKKVNLIKSFCRDFGIEIAVKNTKAFTSSAYMRLQKGDQIIVIRIANHKQKRFYGDQRQQIDFEILFSDNNWRDCIGLLCNVFELQLTKRWINELERR